MTETVKPPRCHYDRQLGERVTSRHRDDCPSRTTEDGACPAAGRGCAPCTAPHCEICGREHLDNAHPDTCPECIGRIREDLVQVAADYAALAVEALAGGHDGQLVAAAPIPGGTAAILHGPTVRLDRMPVTRLTIEFHHAGDLIPPLAVLAQWEDMYRAWFGHPKARRASVAGAIQYLAAQLDHIANGEVQSEASATGVYAHHDGPDWVAFTRQIRNLRAGLERALHDEQEPERGVACFECGERLERRFRDPRRCRHSTPARTELHRALVRQREGQEWMRAVLRTYPELELMEHDLAAARGPSASLRADALRPCAACQDRRDKAGRAVGQGGLDDPDFGRSWECPGCRKQYDVGEYASALRSSLVDEDDETFWCTLMAAAETSSDITGRDVTAKVIRTWIERDGVPVRCPWRPGQRSGSQEVYWPAVLERAAERPRRPGPKRVDRRADRWENGTAPRVVAHR